jgi:nitrite reductase/ring-hydroxylating ferredoxin subunit
VRKIVVGPVASFPPGSKQRVFVGSRAIAIFNVEDTLYALRDACPHQGAALSAGMVVSELRAEQPGDYQLDTSSKCVKCPWHGWEYDLRTGQSYYDPAHDRVRAYETSIEPGAELAGCELPAATTERTTGPYVAETVSVSVEDDYVVLHV